VDRERLQRGWWTRDRELPADGVDAIVVGVAGCRRRFGTGATNPTCVIVRKGSAFPTTLAAPNTVPFA